MISPVAQPLEIDGLKLPPAPQTLIQLIEVCHREDVDFDELHHIVSRDAALVSRILSVAHSAAYGQWKEVDDLRRLLVVLGTDTVRSLALTAAVEQFFSAFASIRGEALGRLWMDGLICGHLCRHLAQLTGFSNGDLAWLAGLLHRLGQLVLLCDEPERYPEMMLQATDLPHLLELEALRYGATHADIGAELVSQWGQENLADALRFQYQPAARLHDSLPLVGLLNRAAQWTLLHQEPSTAVIEDELFGLHQELVIDLIAQAVNEAVRDAGSFSIIVDAHSHYPAPPLDNEQSRLQLAQRVHDLSLIQASNEGLCQPEEPALLLRQLQQNLRLALGLPRSLGFLPGEDATSLRGIDASTRDFRIHLQKGRSHIADCALGEAETGFLHQDDNSLTVVDRQMLERLGRPAGHCLPLRAEGQLQAVLLIGLDAREETRFRQRQGVLRQLADRVARMVLQQRQLRQEQTQALEQQRLELEYHGRELAHEIKNPLTTIRNYLELLSRHIQDEEARPHIDTIKSEIDRVGKLLRQLGQPPQHSEDDGKGPVDVNRLIEDLVALYRPALQAVHDIRCELDLDPGLAPQPIDRNRIKQVLTNLLKNAAEALPPGGRVRVRSRAPVIVDGRSCFEITVGDDGLGIDQSLLPRLFTPIATRKGPDHAGLGLSIVHRLMQEMGGSIRYSRSELGGAEFTLLLPLSSGEAAAASSQ